MKKQISISKTGKYSQSGKYSKKINSVWIVLHGYGMLSEFFIKKFDCIINDTTLVIAPEATNRFYLSNNYNRVGASWMTKLDRNEEIRDNILFLNKLFSIIKKEIGHDNFKLNTLGFSQGGPALVRWLMSNRLNINSLILWGSDIPKDSLIIENKSRWNSMNLKIVIGKHDEYINEEKKQEFIRLVKSYGLKYELIEYEGSHKITEEELKKIANSL
tara:strand:- start:610 stop:1257 length:648 start_codon:yes stop_codon:yes gene_type:complete